MDYRFLEVESVSQNNSNYVIKAVRVPNRFMKFFGMGERGAEFYGNDREGWFVLPLFRRVNGELETRLNDFYRRHNDKSAKSQ